MNACQPETTVEEITSNVRQSIARRLNVLLSSYGKKEARRALDTVLKGSDVNHKSEGEDKKKKRTPENVSSLLADQATVWTRRQSDDTVIEHE